MHEAWEAGKAMDEEVHRRVMELVGKKLVASPVGKIHDALDRMIRGPEERLPRYSTDIAAAWKLVAFLLAGSGRGGMWFVITHVPEATPPHYYASIGRGDERAMSQGVADTAPLAICRAALAAMEGM